MARHHQELGARDYIWFVAALFIFLIGAQAHADDAAPSNVDLERRIHALELELNELKAAQQQAAQAQQAAQQAQQRAATQAAATAPSPNRIKSDGASASFAAQGAAAPDGSYSSIAAAVGAPIARTRSASTASFPSMAGSTMTLRPRMARVPPG